MQPAAVGTNVSIVIVLLTGGRGNRGAAAWYREKDFRFRVRKTWVFWILIFYILVHDLDFSPIYRKQYLSHSQCERGIMQCVCL